MWQSILQLFIKYREPLWQGAQVTLQMCTTAWIVGLLVGSGASWIAFKSRLFNIFLNIFAFILAGIPVLVFLFWLHYPAQVFVGITIDPFWTATFMLTVINMLTVSQIILNGLNNIPNQYIEVARVAGIKPASIFFHIQLPLLARHIIPSILTSQLTILHLSLFASLISVGEIFRISQRIIAIEYKPVEIYTALGIIFLLISLPVNGVSLYLKKRFGRRVDEK